MFASINFSSLVIMKKIAKFCKSLIYTIPPGSRLNLAYEADNTDQYTVLTRSDYYLWMANQLKLWCAYVYVPTYA